MKNKPLYLLLCCLCCAVAVHADEPAEPQAVSSPLSATDATVAEIPIGFGEALNIQVFGHDDLTGVYPVEADGSIAFPLLGRVKVAGMDATAVREMITQRLDADYIVEPVVQLKVELPVGRDGLPAMATMGRGRAVAWAFGDVGKPGVYPLSGRTRLLELLAMADGVGPALASLEDDRTVRILRGAHSGELVRVTSTNDIANAVTNSSARVIEISLAAAVSDIQGATNPMLMPGDVVFVPKPGSVYVMGEVKRSGSVPFEPGLTVLKAISISGGATDVASLKGAFVRRVEDGEVRKIRVELSDTLKPDDVLEIPVRFW